MKKAVSIILTIAMIFMMLPSTVTVNAEVTTTTVARTGNKVAKIAAATAGYTGEKFQIRYNVNVTEGDEITFKIKPYGEATAITVRDGSGSDHTKFLASATLDGKNERVIDIGDGWYLVIAEATTTCTQLGIACDDNAYTGAAIYIDDLKIGSADEITFDNATSVNNFVEFYDYPSEITPTMETMNTTWEIPTEIVIVGGPKEYVKPVFTSAEIDAAPYTWAINKSIGGVVGLPAVVLDGSSSNVNNTLISAMDTAKFQTPKNIIFIISDGFGLDEVKLAEAHDGNMLMNDLPNKAESMTASYSETSKTLRITDSAAGGTALSTGYKTAYYNEAIDFDGKDIPQITEVLRKRGKKIGVVSTGWVSDATPAVYGGAHAVRGESTEIMTEMLMFAPDILIGSGAGDYDSIVNANSAFVKSQDIGYYSNWTETVNSTESKLLVTLPDDIKYTQSATESVPTASQMMAFSLSWLQKNSGDDGFFLMFENGMTDDAGHKNDPTRMVGEAQNTDEVLAIAIKFALENPDTIVILTSDHETGNLTLKDGWETDLTKAKFTLSGHSIQNVPVYAIGKGTEIFNGLTLLNSQVGKITAYLAGVENFGDPDVKMLPDGTEIPEIIEEYIPTTGITDINVKTADSTGYEFTISNLTINNGEMITFMIKPYSTATSLSVTGANISDVWLNDSPLDGEVNYVRDGWYNVTVKAHEADTALKFTLGGAVAKGATIKLADLKIGVASANIVIDGADEPEQDTSFDPDPVFTYSTYSNNGNVEAKISSIDFTLLATYTELTIPEKVKLDGVIYKVTGIDSTLFDAENKVGVFAGLGTTVLDKLIIDADLIIPYRAFFGTPAKTLVISGDVVFTGEQAFRNSTNIEKLIITGAVGTLPDRTFYYCTKLSEVNMYYGITAIGTYAFYGTSALTYVTIPSSVMSVATNAFCGYASGDTDNTKLQTIRFEATETEISNTSGIVPESIKTGSRLVNTGFKFEYGTKIDNVATAAGVQASAIEDTKQNIRFAATIDSLGAEKVGYDIVIRYSGLVRTASIDTTTVYAAINASVNGVNTQYTAEECGGAYIYALTIVGVPTDLGDITFEITPYTIVDGVKISGKMQTAVYRNGIYQS